MSNKIKPEERIGQRFGMLVITDIIRDGSHKVIAECLCDCGKIHEVMLTNLQGGNTISCGCAKRERIRQIGYEKKTHGCSHYHTTREYRSWQGMKHRCYNPNDPFYKDYGDRGITVCDQWRNSFETFLKDMGDRPIGKTLDRIDNNGNYCPENCKWSTQREQGRNTRVNRLFEYNGKMITLAELSEICGKNSGTLHQIIVKAKWTVEEAVETPIGQRRKFKTQTTLETTE
jgi:hypothetical protein